MHRKFSCCLYNSVCCITLLTSYSTELRNLVRTIMVLMFCVTKLITSIKNYCMFLFTTLYFLQYYSCYMKWCDINGNLEHKIWYKHGKNCTSTLNGSLNLTRTSLWKESIDLLKWLPKFGWQNFKNSFEWKNENW